MKETVFYALNITSNISTIDHFTRLMGDELFRQQVEQQVARLVTSALDNALGQRPVTRARLEVEILPLKESRSVLGPPP